MAESRTRRLALAGLVLIATALLPQIAAAQHRGFGPNPDRAPSVFAYGFRGLAIGVPVGLSAGYLITRDDDWGTEDWKGLAYGAGAGAIVGSVAGMGVGFYDLGQRRPGVGMVVLRDTWYGTLLGGAVGLIGGTIGWVGSGDPELLLVGTAWGTVIGAPIGTVVGFIEGPRVRDSALSHPTRKVQLALGISPLAVSRRRNGADLRRELVWGPTIHGSF